MADDSSVIHSAIDDGTGRLGYNPGKILVPADVLRNRILILWEDNTLRRIPEGDIWVRGDAIYGPCSLNWWPTGIIKVSDGTEVKVQYDDRDHYIGIIITYQGWFSPDPRPANPTDPRPGNRERGWPTNPFDYRP